MVWLWMEIIMFSWPWSKYLQLSGVWYRSSQCTRPHSHRTNTWCCMILDRWQLQLFHSGRFGWPREDAVSQIALRLEIVKSQFCLSWKGRPLCFHESTQHLLCKPQSTMPANYLYKTNYYCSWLFSHFNSPTSLQC